MADKKSIWQRAGLTVADSILGFRSYFVFFFTGNIAWILVLSISAGCIDGTFTTVWRVLGTAGLISGASMMIGGMAGFIFGIPRGIRRTATNGQADGDAEVTETVGIQANTNLEQISDWLTKVLVGVGLTQIAKLGGALDQLGSALAPAFLPLKAGSIIGLSIVLAFGLAGFGWAYFESRTSLMQVFDTGDDAAPPQGEDETAHGNA